MTSDTATLLQDVIARARKAGAESADVLMVESAELGVSWRKGKSEGLNRAESSGIGLRVFIGTQQAITSSTDTSAAALSEMVERAVAMARVAPADPQAGIAASEMLAKHVPALDLYDAATPSEETLVEHAARAEAAALAEKGITNTEGAEAGYSASTVTLAASNGFTGSYRSGMHSLSVSVLAGEGTRMERDYDYTVRRFAGDMKSPEAVGKKAAARALARLNPRKTSTCQVPLVFDPRVARSLLSSFAGAINGASVARGTSFLKDKMGTELFEKNIRIVDDPHVLRGLGSKPVDAEGIAGKKRAFVENGVLTGWLLDLRSARQLGMQSTGHASRGLASAPSPSPTNFYMEAGEVSPEALMRDITSGFYVTEAFGMGVNMVTGDYSQGASGFWIENGERAYPVSEVTIAGHLLDMFRKLTPANDLVFDYATNAPTLRIDGMTVAGA